MRRTAELVSYLSIAGLFAVFIAAKIDFFRQFDPTDLTGYLVGHWPFWAGALALATLGQVASRLGTPSPRGK